MPSAKLNFRTPSSRKRKIIEIMFISTFTQNFSCNLSIHEPFGAHLYITGYEILYNILYKSYIIFYINSYFMSDRIKRPNAGFTYTTYYSIFWIFHFAYYISKIWAQNINNYKIIWKGL